MGDEVKEEVEVKAEKEDVSDRTAQLLLTDW